MSNRTAIITGAARRLGAAIAGDLHRIGMDVVIHYHYSYAEAHALAQRLNTQRPGSAHAIAADLASTASCLGLVDQACAINDRLDVLVNNAAVFYPTPVTEVDDRTWNDVINVNLRAPMFLSRAAAAHLARTSGCIINITDVHAERPLRNHSLYSVSKAGLTMLTRALAKELGPAVRVNAISPGAILWPEDLDEETRNKILARTTLKRAGTVEDITRAISYLVDGANYTTGQVLVIDGGRTLHS